MNIDYKYLKENNLIIFETIVGSTAYGTNLPTSDQDKKYVFILPLDMILSNQYVEQVSDERNDHVGYEIGRFFELLGNNNPNLFDLLYAPDDCILYKNDIWDILLKNRHLFLSKLCELSFGTYGISQIKKARSQNKKFINPMEKERKTPLNFCYVIDNGKSYDLIKWLKEHHYEQKFIGAVNIPHAENNYALYYDKISESLFSENIPEYIREKSKKERKEKGLKFGLGYKGLINDDNLDSNALRLSSIPKEETSIATIYYNQNGYSQYCKSYREYWDWDKKKNPERYNTNIEHGKGYDGKNLSHCVRLLQICLEIGKEKKVNIRRTNVDELLAIRRGEMEYDDIIKKADDLMDEVKKSFEISDLPDQPDKTLLKDLLLRIRKSFYKI